MKTSLKPIVEKFFKYSADDIHRHVDYLIYSSVEVENFPIRRLVGRIKWESFLDLRERVK